MPIRLAAAALAALVAAPPAAAAPSTERRALEGFDRVELSAPVDVEVTEGAPFAVSVTIAPEAQPRIETRVEGNTLVIRTREALRTFGPARVTVALPVLRAVAVNGAGAAKVEGASAAERDVSLEVNGSGDLAWKGKGRAVAVRVRGAGDARLDGEARRLDAVVDGSGAVRARGLVARDATLRTHGAGDVEASLRGGALRASTDGAGEIRWWGDAKVEESRVSGSGEIAHAR